MIFLSNADTLTERVPIGQKLRAFPFKYPGSTANADTPNIGIRQMNRKANSVPGAPPGLNHVETLVTLIIIWRSAVTEVTLMRIYVATFLQHRSDIDEDIQCYVSTIQK